MRTLGDERRCERGFTLVELMTVIAILAILVAIALPRYKTAVIRAREAALKEDLYRMRQAIDQYYAHEGRYPASKEALVEDGYLRSLEPDPMTQALDWVEVPAEAGDDYTEGTPGIYDVHSASEATGLNGVPYEEW